MLHSEDADINKVIGQVIELDKKAIRIKKNVMERSERIIVQTKRRIADREKIELKGAQELAKQNYQVEIAKAEDEQSLIINSMEQNIDKVRCRYDERKDEKAAEVLDKLFKARKNEI
ncbi:MAG: hypothetical protein ACOH15_11940 [Acetobacterium sp.]